MPDDFADWLANTPVTEIADKMLPYSRTGFAVAAVAALLSRLSKPMTYFEFVTFTAMTQWDHDPIPPSHVRFAGALSMAICVRVAICDGFIGFV